MKGDTVRKAVGAILYYAIAARLPVSHSRLRLGQTQLRRFCARLMLAECGKRVNVEKGAVFSTRVTIGDENTRPDMQGCSVMMSTATEGGKKAMVGLVGPMRMNYASSIAVLEAVLDGLNHPRTGKEET